VLFMDETSVQVLKGTGKSGRFHLN
jgi:hypothetical protein